MASAQVLQTPELLEMILLSVSCRDLLLSQRVDRTWRGTIQGSVKLKRVLFLAPAGPVLTDFGTVRLTHEGDLWGPIKDDKTVDRLFRYAVNEHATEAFPVAMNPLMAPLFPIVAPTQELDDFMAPFTSKEETAFNRPEASWRDMFICQPPVSCIWASRHVKWAHECRFYSDDVEPIGLNIDYLDRESDDMPWSNEHGLTISDIAEYYEEFHNEMIDTDPPLRVVLNDVFTWWRPRADHVTAETLAADVKRYSWRKEAPNLNTYPSDFCDENGELIPDWEQWTY
ncbi:hypothetical protein CBER1_10244 [Cercospora berteroae]|uniref:F-box domain-containing protein n=1 Tax=Cercospora berteroae TaxID=357750 RepID=A0A2S6BXC1_9PEZI|nr:hypothetical protein CBER1_10244 [Cercospora berteroae]